MFSVVKEKNILAMPYASSAIPVTLREAFQKRQIYFISPFFDNIQGF